MAQYLEIATVQGKRKSSIDISDHIQCNSGEVLLVEVGYQRVSQLFAMPKILSF